MSQSLYTKTILPARPNPTPLGPQMYRGFSTVNTDTNNFALYDFELIKQDLINMFNIQQGERLMNPTFGCVIWDLLFEPLTDQVKSLMLQNVNDIINFDPRVQASNVTITQYDTGIQLEFTLTYVTYNLSQVLQVQFDQNNGLLTNQTTSTVTSNVSSITQGAAPTVA
jgi:phage baseplate assembly protein W